MKEKIRDFLLKYVGEMMDVIIIIIAIILLINGVFSKRMFLRGALIFLFVVIYKGLVMQGKFDLSGKDLHAFYTDEMVEKIFVVSGEKKFKKLVDQLAKKDLVWLPMILLAILPWNGIRGLILFYYAVRNYIFLIVIGAKDVIYKKYFSKDMTQWLPLRLYNSGFWFIGIGGIAHPIKRFLLIPQYMREKLLLRSGSLMLRLRVISYALGLIYLEIGYYEFVAGIHGGWKGLAVYVYCAIIWPFFLYQRREIFPEERVFLNRYYEPNYLTFCHPRSLTLGILASYIRYVNYQHSREVSFVQKVIDLGFMSDGIPVGLRLKVCMETGFKGQYEKIYLISHKVFYMLVVDVRIRNLYAKIRYIVGAANYINRTKNKNGDLSVQNRLSEKLVDAFAYCLVMEAEARKFIGLPRDKGFVMETSSDDYYHIYETQGLDEFNEKIKKDIKESIYEQVPLKIKGSARDYFKMQANIIMIVSLFANIHFCELIVGGYLERPRAVTYLDKEVKGPSLYELMCEEFPDFKQRLDNYKMYVELEEVINKDMFLLMEKVKKHYFEILAKGDEKRLIMEEFVESG